MDSIRKIYDYVGNKPSLLKKIKQGKLDKNQIVLLAHKEFLLNFVAEHGVNGFQNTDCFQHYTQQLDDKKIIHFIKESIVKHQKQIDIDLALQCSFLQTLNFLFINHAKLVIFLMFLLIIILVYIISSPEQLSAVLGAVFCKK